MRHTVLMTVVLRAGPAGDIWVHGSLESKRKPSLMRCECEGGPEKLH